MTTDDETWEVRSKNTPAITDYRHRCHERERNENLWDYNFNNETHGYLYVKGATHGDETIDDYT